MLPERITIGSVEILSLSDTTTTNDACMFFPENSPDEIKSYGDYVDPDCNVREPVNVGSFLIFSKGKKILVDAGLGPDPVEIVGGAFGDLTGDLKRHGILPEEIDKVLITHMHFDHIGWLAVSRNGKVSKTFANAEYIMPKADYELLLNPEQVKSPPPPNHFSPTAAKLYASGAYMGRNISQIEELELVSGEFNITDEVKTLPTPGHTPGHQSLLISSGGERAFVLGDVAHLPMQLEVSDWIVVADVQPELGSKTRKRILEWLESEGLIVAAGHFPSPGFGRVIKVGGRRYWEPL
ncbi:MBL fold metallo-hydrolase [SAR202 cluster bacterium AD-804-J14_MRT_500m]|nr:MBL fold metallo-hydrolase [SAR202 cluster bacterium AD-804-J14_MRT_500m]